MIKAAQPAAEHSSMTRGLDDYYVRIERPLGVDGHAGASAQRQADVRRKGESWAKGATGERTVGAILDGLVRRGVVVLHDRAIPGSKANIDHITVGPRGVHVIDPKHYTGRVEVREGRLFVKGRHRGKLVDSMERQAWEVEAALAQVDVPVHPVLCFVGSQWPLIRRPLQFGRVAVVWPQRLEDLVWGPGSLGSGDVQRLGAVLRDALPPAR